ncbi:RNA chaperone ProQ [compost metagenome]|uniref:ProQ/FinO family protein n=1 Tax=Cupriavidus necator TaxID=106590 RepID=UPI0028BC4EA4
MGFEQLAALRDQLANKAKAESRTEGKRRRPAPAAAPAAAPAKPPVDPVVHSIARLQKHFPKAFPKNPAPKVPLKVGTFEDLAQHAGKLALTEAELREAIRTWCSGARYWSCMVEGAKRLDLDGNEAGVVSLADAKRAQQLKARRSAGARPRKAKPATPAATPDAPAAPAATTPDSPDTPATA